MKRNESVRLAMLAVSMAGALVAETARATAVSAYSPVVAVDTRTAVVWDVMAWADLNGDGLYDTGEELSGADVYYGGRMAEHRVGQTGSDGRLEISLPPRAGMQIFIRKEIHHEPALKGGHEDVDSRMFTLWLDSDMGATDSTASDGTWRPYILSSVDEAAAYGGLLDVQLKHPVFEWNLLIATEAGDPVFSDKLRTGLERASTYLFDVTDGQMKLGKVAIYRGVEKGSTAWTDADIVIYNEADYWPNSHRDGVRSGDSLFGRFPRQMYFGSTWEQDSPENERYYRTIIHEFGHYGFGFFDEYRDGNGSQDSWTNYRLGHPGEVPKNYGIMDSQYDSSEMSSYNDYLSDYNWPVQKSNVTMQLSGHATLLWQSWYPCWQWLAERFAGAYEGIPVSITVPPYGVFMGNDTASSDDRSGPSRIPLPYTACEVMLKMTNPAPLVRAMSAPIVSSTDKRDAVLVQVKASGRAARGARVFHTPAGRSDLKSLGRTDRDGRLVAYDVVAGDTLVVCLDGRKICRQVTEQDQSGPIEISQTIPALKPGEAENGPLVSSPLGVIVSGKVVMGNPALLSLEIRSSMTLVAPPAVILHIDEAAGVPVVMSALGPQIYEGSLAVAVGQVGSIEISCQSTNGETLTTTDQFRLDGAETDVSTMLWSRDGTADARLAAGAAVTNCMAMVYSGFAPTIYSDGFNKVLVGPVISSFLGATSGLNGTTGVVNVAYRDADTVGVDETTIRLYSWSDAAWQWEPVESGVSVDANVVSASVTNMGVMALFADATTDAVAPGRINDLTVSTGTNGWSVLASWTAPGDDGNAGTATAYILNYSTNAITTNNWNECASLSLLLSPKPAGGPESAQLQMPDPGRTYFFAIHAKDEAGNAGPISNIATAKSYQTDSDGDGMPDQWEATFGLSATNSADAELDLDGDGLTNRQEFELGTNPAAWDSDGDGMSDGWEYEYGLNPLSAEDGALDPDHDGLVNLQEYQCGRNPHAYDTLQLTSCEMQSDGSVSMTANGVVGKAYTLEVSTNLTYWSVEKIVGFTNTIHVFADTSATNAPVRFYRLRE